MAEKKEKTAEPAKKTNAALDAVLSQIKKEFGELSIMRLGGDEHANIPVISTSLPAVMSSPPKVQRTT